MIRLCVSGLSWPGGVDGPTTIARPRPSRPRSCTAPSRVAASPARRPCCRIRSRRHPTGIRRRAGPPSPKRSRIVLLYSARLSRRMVTRPGLPGLPQSSRSSAALIEAVQASDLGAGRLRTLLGRHDPALDILADPLPRLVDATGTSPRPAATPGSARPSVCRARGSSRNTSRGRAGRHREGRPLPPVRDGPPPSPRGRLAGDPPRRPRSHPGPAARDQKESNVTTHPCLVVKLRCPIGRRLILMRIAIDIDPRCGPTSPNAGTRASVRHSEDTSRRGATVPGRSADLPIQPRT